MSTPRPQSILPYERTPEHVPVASFATAAEAHLAAGKLEAQEVDCVVSEHAVLEGISARGATVLVEAEQLRRAVEVLSATPARRCLLVRAAEPAEHKGGGAPPSGTETGLLRRFRQWWRGAGGDAGQAHQKALP